MLTKFCKYLRTEKRYSEHTITAYETDISAFFEFVELSIDNSSKINYQLIRAWISAMLSGDERIGGKKFSTRSVSRKIASLKSFFNYLRREGVVQQNPTAKITSPKISKHLPIFLKEEKLNNYLDTKSLSVNDFVETRNLTILEMLYGTGIRVSELVGIQLNDIDLSSKTVKIQGKGNKQRFIPLSAKLEHILNHYLEFRNKEFSVFQNYSLFLTSKGKPIYTKLVYIIVYKYLTEGGFTEKRSPHILRHSFATHLLNNEANLNAIKELLGHANLSATQIYTHNSFTKMKKIYKKAHPHAESQEGEKV